MSRIDRAFLESRTEEVSSPSIVCNPKATIVVITYQHVGFVAQCLESVLAQDTRFPFEIVIADDCSTDGTLETVLKYQHRFPGIIRCLRAKENLGKYCSNYGLNSIRGVISARAPCLHVLEGDDYWCDSRKLQKQVDLLEEHPQAAGVFHDVAVTGPDKSASDTRQYWGNPNEKLQFSLRDITTPQSPLHVSSLLFRRETLDNTFLLGDFLCFQSADMALFIKIASWGPLIRIAEIMSVYRKHAGGITNTTGHTLAMGIHHRIWMWNQLRKSIPEAEPYLEKTIGEGQKIFFGAWPSLPVEHRRWLAMWKVWSYSPLRTFPRLAGLTWKTFAYVWWHKISVRFPWSIPETIDLAYVEREMDRRSNRPFVIWGTGKAGKVVWRIVRKKQSCVVCFLDTNPDKKGQKLRGLPIYTPESFFNEHDGSLHPVLILASMHAQQMALWLRENEYEKSIDLIWPTPLKKGQT